jgi:hypothetical protein
MEIYVELSQIIPKHITAMKSRDSVGCIAASYRLDNRGLGVQSPSRDKNFLFSMSSRTVLRFT